jgi:tetratricopeptide (TPR) repeat protein
MEALARTNPGNTSNLLALATVYLQMQKTGRATEVLDLALKSPNITYEDAAGIAGIYSQMHNYPKLEGALQKLAALAPTMPEPRFDLARLEATLGQIDQAMADLQTAITMNNVRRKTDPAARDLLVEARQDTALASLRSLPAFQKIISTN